MAARTERGSEAPEPLDGAELVSLMRALSDPVRLRIVQVLSSGEPMNRSTTDWDCDLSRATMSHHFGVLREAGLISTSVSGRTQQVRLRVDDIERRFPGLLTLVSRERATS